MKRISDNFNYIAILHLIIYIGINFLVCAIIYKHSKQIKLDETKIHKTLSRNKSISVSKSKENINKNEKKSELKEIEERETQQNSLSNKKPGIKPSDEKSPKDSNISEEVSPQSHQIQKASEEFQQKLKLFENKIK